MKNNTDGDGNADQRNGDDSILEFDVVMTPELEHLLDEGLENLDRARTTDEIRRRS